MFQLPRPSMLFIFQELYYLVWGSEFLTLDRRMSTPFTTEECLGMQINVASGRNNDVNIKKVDVNKCKNNIETRGAFRSFVWHVWWHHGQLSTSLKMLIYKVTSVSQCDTFPFQLLRSLRSVVIICWWNQHMILRNPIICQESLKTDHLPTPFVVWLIGFVELIQLSWIGLIDLYWWIWWFDWLNWAHWFYIVCFHWFHCFPWFDWLIELISLIRFISLIPLFDWVVC